MPLLQIVLEKILFNRADQQISFVGNGDLRSVYSKSQRGKCASNSLRITHCALDVDHCIKKPLINQQRRDNIGDKPMNRRTYLLLLLIIVCLSVPLAVSAQVTELAIISGSGQSGRPGQALEPFVVEGARSERDPCAKGTIVHFLPRQRLYSCEPDRMYWATTDDEGRSHRRR